jgi:flagellar motor switch protein FliM
MPEILSQSQIDALLKGLDSGEVESLAALDSPQRRIKEYDFKSPKKFTKEQLKTLEALHENFARVLSSFFSGYFRTSCEISIQQIEEQRYYEYNNALQDIALISMLDLKPAKEDLDDIPMLIDTSTSIGYYMVDRLLGGPGTSYNISRDYTDIEIAVLENFYKKIANILQEIWRNNIEVSATFNGITTNPRMLQTYSPDEIVVIILFSMKIKDLMGNMSICIPAANIEAIIGNFSTKYSRAAKKLDADKENQRKQLILNTLTQSDLEMKAVLQELQLDIQDILKLQVDDVIPLNKKVNSNICIMVEDTPWFSAELGETNLKKAVKINQFIESSNIIKGAI